MSLKDLSKQRGFSLIQVIVAMGLLAALSVAFMRMQENQAKSTRTLKVKMDIDQFMMEMQGLLSKPSICALNFKGQKPEKIKLTEFLKRKKRPKFVVGQKNRSESFIVTSFGPKDYYYDDDSDFLGVIEMLFTIEKVGRVNGSKTVKRNFDINFEVDDKGLIKNCVLLGAGSLGGTGAVGKGFSSVDVKKAIVGKADTKDAKSVKSLIDKSPALKEMKKSIMDINAHGSKMNDILESWDE